MIPIFSKYLLFEERGCHPLDLAGQQGGAPDDLAECGQRGVDKLDQGDSIVALQLDKGGDRAVR